ncbi:anti-sigma factor domain-containing protein [Tumebacillus permanentifrigoris]|uniref:Anti-sigma factor-like protein n=1 Tax=Tumebacillus permanentifrigoris TaxID=378543 RepID=A0A316D7C3_9BACL|nr:anti-sigma factor domain-containing protein [Tumebacillus permanentifrigoris]PWK08968.1 anti-sigma factor-like protein [Tumebacillus permanentifrigoris]
MQNKGIVMQIANHQAVVMTQDCQFRKIPLLEGMTIGQEVEFPADVLLAMPSNNSKQAWYAKPWRKTGLVAASVLLAVGLWGGQSFLGETPAYAYVTVDINPSVELSIGKNQHVLLATALNDEAEIVLQELKLKGMPINEAVEALAQAAQTKGFFQDTTEVIISTSAAVDAELLKNENVDLVKLEGDLVSKLKTVAVQQHPSVEVEGVTVSKEVREAAKQAGVSPGKYALYLNATSNGIEVELDDLKANSIHQVVDQQPQMATVVHELQGGDKLDALLKTLKEEGKNSLLNSNNKNKGILPSTSPSTDSKQSDDGKKVPPGQAKKDEDKQDDKKGEISKQNSTPETKSNNGNKGSTQKSDDDHAKSQTDNKSKNQNRNDDKNNTKNNKNEDKNDDKKGHYDIHVNLPGQH